MIESFHKKRNKGCNPNETFQYQDRIITLVAPLKNLVTPDCEGDCNHHLNAAQSILTIFALIDYVYYLQWCPLYLTDMRSLLETDPETQVLLQCQFVVKRTRVKFKDTRF